MSPLRVINSDATFEQKVKLALAAAPIFGDPASTSVWELAHFSRDGNIDYFRGSDTAHWSNCISDQLHVLADVNKLSGRPFSAIYLLRFGESSKFKVISRGSGISTEYAIYCDIPKAFLVRRALILNSIVGRYVI